MNIFRPDILAGVVTALPFVIAGKDTVDESHLEELAAEYDRLNAAHQAERGCTRAAVDLWCRMMQIRRELAGALPDTDTGVRAVLRVEPGHAAWIAWRRGRGGMAS